MRGLLHFGRQREKALFFGEKRKVFQVSGLPRAPSQADLDNADLLRSRGVDEFQEAYDRSTRMEFLPDKTRNPAFLPERDIWTHQTVIEMMEKDEESRATLERIQREKIEGNLKSVLQATIQIGQEQSTRTPFNASLFNFSEVNAIGGMPNKTPLSLGANEIFDADFIVRARSFLTFAQIAAQKITDPAQKRSFEEKWKKANRYLLDLERLVNLVQQRDSFAFQRAEWMKDPQADRKAEIDKRNLQKKLKDKELSQKKEELSKLESDYEEALRNNNVPEIKRFAEERIVKEGEIATTREEIDVLGDEINTLQDVNAARIAASPMESLKKQFKERGIIDRGMQRGLERRAMEYAKRELEQVMDLSTPAGQFLLFAAARGYIAPQSLLTTIQTNRGYLQGITRAISDSTILMASMSPADPRIVGIFGVHYSTLFPAMQEYQKWKKGLRGEQKNTLKNEVDMAVDSARNEFEKRTNIDVAATCLKFWTTISVERAENPTNAPSAEEIIQTLEVGSVHSFFDQNDVIFGKGGQDPQSIMIMSSDDRATLAHYLRQDAAKTGTAELAFLNNQDYENPQDFFDTAYETLSDMVTSGEPKDMLAAGIVFFGMFKALFGKNQWSKALKYGVAGLAAARAYEKATGESLLDKVGITSSEAKGSKTPGGVESTLIQNRKDSLNPEGVEASFFGASEKVRNQVVMGIHDIPAQELLTWENGFRNGKVLSEAPKNISQNAPRQLRGIFIEGVENTQVLTVALGFLHLSYKNADFREHPEHKNLTVDRGREIFSEALKTISDITGEQESDISFGEVLSYLQRYEEMTTSASMDRRLDQKAMTFLQNAGSSIAPFLSGAGEYTQEKAKEWYLKITSIYTPKITDTIQEMWQSGWRAAENGFDDANGTLRFVRENYRVEISNVGSALRIVFLDAPIGAVTVSAEYASKAADALTKKYEQIKEELRFDMTPADANASIESINSGFDLAQLDKIQLGFILNPAKQKITDAYGLLRDEDYTKFLEVLTKGGATSPLTRVITEKFGADPDEKNITREQIAKLILNPDVFYTQWLNTMERWGKKGANAGVETADWATTIAGFIPFQLLDIVDLGSDAFPMSPKWWMMDDPNQIGLDFWKTKNEFFQNAKFDIPPQTVDFRATQDILRTLGDHNVSQNSESTEVIWTTEMLKRLELVAVLEKVLGKKILVTGTFWWKKDNWKQMERDITEGLREIEKDPTKKSQTNQYFQKLHAFFSSGSFVIGTLTPSQILQKMHNYL